MATTYVLELLLLLFKVALGRPCCRGIAKAGRRAAPLALLLGPASTSTSAAALIAAASTRSTATPLAHPCFQKTDCNELIDFSFHLFFGCLHKMQLEKNDRYSG
jgi:hypothetical protein